MRPQEVALFFDVINNNQHRNGGIMFECTICGATVLDDAVTAHRFSHPEYREYGIMWPKSNTSQPLASWQVRIHQSDILARFLGVRGVYIRNEGDSPSGSMKDYLVERAVAYAHKEGMRAVTVTSSGNHAASVCFWTVRTNMKAVVFVPASSSKIAFLCSYEHARVIAVENSVFEEAYRVGSRLEMAEVYDANVRNEYLLSSLEQVGCEITALDPAPTQVLAGVGNGTYLAGIGASLVNRNKKRTCIVPTGMRGAFPAHLAHCHQQPVWKFNNFLAPESEIDAAEGSIALESYAMPQLMCALRKTHGHTLPDLTNKDLAAAYTILLKDPALIEAHVIPEPTGIMGLAATLKWRKCFNEAEDVLLISFTGHGVKDLHGIERITETSSARTLIASATEGRPDLLERCHNTKQQNHGKVVFVPKNISARELNALIQKIL